MYANLPHRHGCYRLQESSNVEILESVPQRESDGYEKKNQHLKHATESDMERIIVGFVTPKYLS